MVVGGGRRYVKIDLISLFQEEGVCWAVSLLVLPTSGAQKGDIDTLYVSRKLDTLTSWDVL